MNDYLMRHQMRRRSRLQIINGQITRDKLIEEYAKWAADEQIEEERQRAQEDWSDE